MRKIYCYRQVNGKLVKHKRCSICKNLLPITDFSFNNRDSGISGRCKKCSIKRLVEFGEKYRKTEEYRKKKRESYKKYIAKVKREGRYEKLKKYKRAWYRYGKNIKWCPCCEDYYEKTTDNFFIHRNSEDGFTDFCKKCIEKQRGVNKKSRPNNNGYNYFGGV